MSYTKSKALLAACAMLMVAAVSAQQGQGQPELTPEQKAEMEAFAKAGTPGAAHQGLAATVGSYDLKVRSWMEPGGPPMEETGTATRAMTLDGRVRVEDVSSKMMGAPFTGHGMLGFDNVTGSTGRHGTTACRPA